VWGLCPHEGVETPSPHLYFYSRKGVDRSFGAKIWPRAYYVKLKGAVNSAINTSKKYRWIK